MADNTIVEDWLDRWEEMNAAGQGVSPSEFAALHCVDAPPDLVKQFIAQAEKLISVDRHLHGKEPTAGDGSPDTAGGGGPPTTLSPAYEPVPGYRLVKRLGSGGYGTVWQAIAPGGFPVAMKFLDLGRQVGAEERRALEHIKGLGHPHLLSVSASFVTDAWLIVVSELADRTLADRLQECLRQGQEGIPGPELLRYMQEAAEGLDHLNRSGVQHRDVKPPNFLLVGGSVKVSDFGLAKLLEDTLASHSGSMTAAYAAPEFFDRKTTSHSDQYSLAVTYCQLRSGRLPFTGTFWELMQAHKQQEPDLSIVPAGERQVVSRALSKKPEQRWSSCSEFTRQLAGVVGTTGPDTARTIRWYVLVLDEARSQPDLRNYFSPQQLDEAARAVCGLPLEQAMAALDAGGAGLRLSVEGYGRCPEQFRVSGLYRMAAEGITWVRSQEANYAALCHSGLLFLLSLDFEGCKAKLDLAKHNHNDWAFAHHLYGLMHGLRGDLVGAREELTLALGRETYREPRQRIERALRMVHRQ